MKSESLVGLLTIHNLCKNKEWLIDSVKPFFVFALNTFNTYGSLMDFNY